MASVWEVKGTTATLKEEGTTVATIKGLATGLSLYTDEEGNKKIYGIDDSGSTITLSRKVLGNTTVTIESDNYSLDLDDDCAQQNGGGWVVEGATAYLMDGTSSYYTVEDGTVTYHAAVLGNGGVLATLSGLASGTVANSLGEIPGVTVTGTTIEISKGSIIGSDGLTVSGTGYTLALGSELKPAASGEVTWESTKKGAASFTATLTAGYSLDSPTKIKVTPSTNATVTVSGLNSKVSTAELAAWINGTGDYEGEPAFTVSGSVITVNDNSILTSSTKLTGADYTFALADYTDEENSKNSTAEIGEDTWSMLKGKTAATYGHTIGIGYYADGASIKQNSSKESTVTYVTVTGLSKATDAVTGVDGLSVSGNVVTVSQDLLESGSDTLIKANAKTGTEARTGVKKLTIGAKENYTFAFDDDVEVPEDDEEGRAWTFDSGSKTKNGDTTYTGKGTAVLSIGTSDGWAIDTSTKGASKTINYVAEKTTTFVTLSGLTTNFVDSLTGDLDADFKLEAENGVYTGNILYTGGSDDDDSSADTAKVYALKVTDGDNGNKVITLNESVFGGKKITVKSNNKVTGETYKLALDKDYSVKDVETPEWSVTSAGKATLIGGKTAGYVLNEKTGAIDYTAAKPTTLATITLKGYINDKNKVAISNEDIAELEAALNAATTFTKDDNGSITGGKVTLDSSILTSNANITSMAFAAKDNYTFELVDEEDDETNGVGVYKEADADPVWIVTPKSNKEADADKPKGTASYSATMQEGYQLSSDSKTVTFKEGGKTTLFTLSGLDTGKTVTDLTAALKGTSTGEDVAADTTTPAVSVSGTTVTINDSSIFGTNKISLGKKDGYTLNVSSIADAELADAQWNIDTAKGTATYYKGTSGGWALDKNSTISASYVKPTTKTTIATVTGLKKKTSFADPTITTVGSTSRIVLTQDMLDTTQVKLSDTTDYKLMLLGVAGATASNEAWTISKGTATYSRDVSQGWAISDDLMSVSYSAGVANQKVVTVKGLNSTLTELGEDDIKVDGTNIILSNAVLNNANVSATSGIKGTTYTLKLGGDVATSTVNTTEWVNSKGTATYKTYDKGYYTEDNAKGTITYNKEKNAVTNATIKGLNTTVSGSDIDQYIHIDDATKVITIDEEALVAEPTAKTVVTLATVRGGTAYKLALQDEKTVTDEDGGETIISAQGVVYDDPDFVEVKNNKDVVTSVILSADVSTAGYEVDSTGLKLTYVPKEVSVKGGGSAANSVTLATVSGVTTRSGLSYEAVEEEVDDGEGGTETVYKNVINVSKEALGKSKVTLGKNDDYTFRLVDDVDTVSAFEAELSDEKLSVKGTTATLNGVVSPTYSISADAKTINYKAGTADGKTTPLATIKGVVKDEGTGEYDDTTKTITIGASDITVTEKKSVVQPQTATVESAYGIAFSFDSTYENASIVGSKNNDIINVAGTGISINASTGNDTVTFGSGLSADDESTTTASGNTFFYKVGDGNDVIADFTAASDKIKLTTANAKVTVAASGSDAVISITDSKGTAKTAGSITLTGLAGSTITIIDSANQKNTYTATAASSDLASSYDLIYDNNYVTGSQLGDLASSADAGLLGDLNTDYNYTNLTQQQTVAYSGTKK